MKIRDGLQNLYKPDLYNNQNSKIKDASEQAKDIASSSVKHTKNNRDQEFSLKKVLSVKELNSLNALFGFEQGGKESLYGNNRIRNVHAGILLDVKG
jgi:hypothetical protein